ncbi:SPOR domain-containing protein [Rheinheimera sp. MMS21-TC3]|uniref:SPOR domain-containing protein n=1 Tax=Rheinheimera sp. MMS21-TC3 TaxID=3072790 RepID=UPI0028C487EA|nr:SPOR domain-containing protein [Rheinheimera sp. MMS21-TC3]WNO60473.1 SPOR domain-containing protein [Rheinheimera sp. MMS21-TC3]
MAHKDYVKTNRAKPKTNKRKPTTKRGKAKQPTTPLPWLAIILATIIVAGFGYFLWYLNQQPTVEVVPEPAKQVAVTPKLDPLPAKPTSEPYQYIKELENKEVKVEVTEQAAAGPYQMQCGSFRSQNQAEEMKAKIAFSGFTAEVRRSEGTNGVWYRVVLGPYESKRQATADRNRLRQQNINTCQIWNWS